MNIGIIKDGRVPDISRAVAWDSAKHLSFALPFGDMKPTVYLGKLDFKNSFEI